MLRRVVIALIIVSLSKFNFFQTQLMILKTSFIIIYQGWVQPFRGKSRNNLEISNETLILINTYFLIVYSDFVGSPEVRYQMGWVNVAFLTFMLLTNILMLVMDLGRNCRKQCKERALKKKRAQNMLKKSQV